MAEARPALLTGASGVIGSALLEVGRPVIALRHREPLRAAVPELRGDIRRPRLGLDREQARDLKGGIGAIVHAAGLTGYDVGREEMQEVVVAGTRRVVEFAEYAEVPVFYTSTVGLRFEDGRAGTAASAATGGFSPHNYMRAKAEAEALLADAAVPTCAMRITWVTGHSASGYVKRFQGLYILAQALLVDSIPLIPADPEDRIDFLPQDTIARAIWRLVDEERHRERVVWLTAGEDALPLQRALEIVAEYGESIGIDVTVPRFAPSDIVERLFRPVFLSELPERQRSRFEQLIGLIGSLPDPFPSAVPGLLPDRPGLEPALRSALGYWAERKRLLRRYRARREVLL